MSQSRIVKKRLRNVFKKTDLNQSINWALFNDLFINDVKNSKRGLNFCDTYKRNDFTLLIHNIRSRNKILNEKWILSRNYMFWLQTWMPVLKTLKV